VELLVAHEGISRGRILGAGQNGPVKKYWSKARIEELVSKLGAHSVPIYLFHDSNNQPRRRVGEIMAATARKVKDRLSALAYAYISDPHVRELIRENKLDTCSIETVSGLALGSRKSARPGFAGAAILAQVEEFEDAGSDQVRELEQALTQKEDELGRLKSELARYKKESERETRHKKVLELVEKHLLDRNLKLEEKKQVVAGVSERIEIKEPGDDHLESSVSEELDRELIRLAELRRLYSKPGQIKAPIETQENSTSNPLIPKE
jgi:signal recognition particle GTPase